MQQSVIEEVNKDTELVEEFKVQMTPYNGEWHDA